MPVEHATRELTPDEAKALTKDLQKILEKHNCEMGVRSVIELMKYVGDSDGGSNKAD